MLQELREYGLDVLAEELLEELDEEVVFNPSGSESLCMAVRKLTMLILQLTEAHSCVWQRIFLGVQTYDATSVSLARTV